MELHIGERCFKLPVAFKLLFLQQYLDLDPTLQKHSSIAPILRFGRSIPSVFMHLRGAGELSSVLYQDTAAVVMDMSRLRVCV